MKKLFEITHPDKEGSKLYVAAENLERVANYYCYSKKIELVSDKIMVLKNKEADTYDFSDQKIRAIMDYIGKQSDVTMQFTRPDVEGEDEDPNIVKYIERMHRRIIDAECSNRGYQSVMKNNNDTMAKMKRVIEDALANEEKCYDDNESLPGWIIEARELV